MLAAALWKHLRQFVRLLCPRDRSLRDPCDFRFVSFQAGTGQTRLKARLAKLSYLAEVFLSFPLFPLPFPALCLNVLFAAAWNPSKFNDSRSSRGQEIGAERGVAIRLTRTAA